MGGDREGGHGRVLEGIWSYFHFSSDRSDPVIWHRTQSAESFEELPGRVSHSVPLVTYAVLAASLNL